MTEIEYTITQIYKEHGAYVIDSNTSWYGRLTFTQEEFDELGRPTVNDVLLLDIRILSEKANKDES